MTERLLHWLITSATALWIIVRCLIDKMRIWRIWRASK
jgi:hypothetical protein